MSQRMDDSIVERLRDIGENLDTLNLGDTEAWEAIAEELARMIWGLPETHSDLERLLRHCRQGILQIAEKSSANCLDLVGAIADALETVERVAGEAGGDSAPALAEASEAVKALVAGGAPGAASAAGDEKGPAETPVETPEAAAEAAAAPPAAGAGEEGERADYMPEDPDVELLGEFVTEALDLLSGAEEALLTLETDPEDMDAVGTIFRAFHTIKGTAAFLDLTLLAEMGHHAESLLSRVRDREIQYAGGYADLSLRALDMLKDLVQSVGRAVGGEPLRKPDLYDELFAVLADPEAAGVSDESEDAGIPRVGDLLVAQGKVPREVVEEVASSGGKPLGVNLVKANAVSMADMGKVLRTQEKMKGAGESLENSVRVSTNRLDRLIDMVGELVVAHSMVAQNDIVVSGNNHELLKKVNHTTKIIRELQDISMSMRMIPLKGTFRKMNRLVRDLSRKVGKEVRLVTEGEETEIDRNMVDIIKDPLVHMIRNAVDHGIEAPEIREDGGKPRAGAIHLSAYHSAGSVVVEIKDDGKGLDREVILAKALENNLVDGVDGLSDREVYNLIFKPGFSTARTVTDVSGRGVGMDVVKKNIEMLRGQVEIDSEAGKGSTFKMRLPLTLAIIDGMVVRVGRERYVIPTVTIVKTVKPEAGEISTMLRRGEMYDLQHMLIPIYRFAALFGIDDGYQDLEDALLVVVECNGKKAGLMIDELLGRQQVVIKTLGSNMQNIPGISGGAVMPDGCVGLIVDVESLVKLATSDGSAMMAGHWAPQPDAVANHLPA